MQTTLPIAPQTFWGLVALIGFLALSLSVTVLLPKADAQQPPVLHRLQQRMGLSELHPALALLVAMLWAGLFLVLTAGLYALILDVAWHTSAPENARDDLWDFRFKLAQIAALTAVLGDLQKPAHWDQSAEPLDPIEFENAWRAYQASIGQNPKAPT